MLRSINPPPDPHDVHLRQLLDQRATRADFQGRFSTLSQFSDTPSVYSRPFFSPRSVDREPTSPTTQSRITSPNTFAYGHRTQRDRLDDPTASMLDLDEDPRLSTTSYDENDEEQSPDEDDEHLPRMSLLGPRMRFHSRAPWEMEGGVFQEEDENDYGSLLSISRKGFGRSSPRSSSASRPSGESTRSQAKSKHSFETTSSQLSYPRGALYALAQESLSTSSLSPPTGQKGLRGKFYMSRVRSESPNNSLPPSPSPSDTRSPTDTRSINFPHPPHHKGFPPTDSHASDADFLRRPTYSADDFHPYANPDLVEYAQDQPPYHQSSVSRSDSIATVTDSFAFNSLSSSGTRSILAPVASASSATTRNRTSTLQGKEISSPVSVVNNTLHLDTPFHANDDQSPRSPHPGVENLPGWTDRGTAPTFALISLEEARAQRSRSATVNHVMVHPPDSIPTVPFPDIKNGTEGKYNGDTGFSSATHRGRARSISAGAKAKNALHSMVGSGGQAKQDNYEPEPTIAFSSNIGFPGKSLKHKKSGFMRLFNGGRAQEKEEKAQPPPVPSLSDAHALHNAQTVHHKAPKIATHRIPVPELSPSHFEDPSSQEGEPSSSKTGFRKPSPSPKRPIPMLSINTQPQGYASRGPASAAGDTSSQARTMTRVNDPQSAPANVSEFPALQLRPVSTIFSAQFGDHIMRQDSRPSLETDMGTPSSNIFSPITPGSAARSERLSNDKQFAMPDISEDQSSVISALQDQILTAKLAWQRQIWELEGQVRDLKAEVDELQTTGNTADYCDSCGRGRPRLNAACSPHRGSNAAPEDGSSSVIHRPRARTGTSARFGSAVS